MTDQPDMPRREGSAPPSAHSGDANSKSIATVRAAGLSTALSACYGVGSLVCGVFLMVEEFDELMAGIFIWGIAFVVLALPVSLLIANLALRFERALVRGPVPDPWTWSVFAGGVAATGHWAPIAVWALAVAGWSLTEGARAGEVAGLAVLAAVVWVITAGAAGFAVTGWRLVHARDWSGSLPRPGAFQAFVPSSVVAGVAYGLCAAPLAVLWLALLTEVWGRPSGTYALWSWLFLGVGVASVCGGATGAVGRLASLGRQQLRQMEVAGGVLVMHFLGVFVVTLSPVLERDADVRFCAMWLAYVAICAGTALWSAARFVGPVLLPRGVNTGESAAG